MADGERFSGAALASIAAGGLLVFAGIKGYSIGSSAQDIIQGKTPLKQKQVTAITGTASSSTSAASVPPGTTASAIASDALRYAGHAYLYGGAPGPTGQGPWDCSSFVNWVLGHDLGFTLPGETAPGYTGLSHGPTTVAYLTWAQAETIGHKMGVAVAGDLCVWQTHMGICTGPDQMISAQDPAAGTGVSSIYLPGEFLFVRRIIIGDPDA